MTTEQKIIKAKIGLLELAKQLGNVSQACKVMGYSRDSFYRFKELYDKGGDLALIEMSRRKPFSSIGCGRRSRPPWWRWRSTSQPCGQARVSNELRKQGLVISTFGVRSVWLRHDVVLEARLRRDRT
jgi:hypothetical protein